MTTYYVRPGVGSDTNGGTSWASDSWATLKKATDTVTAGDHTIVMDTANDDVITVNTTYTIAAGIKIISSSDGTTYAAGAEVNSTTFGVDIGIAGQFALFGIAFRAATTGTSTVSVVVSDDDFCYAEDCIFAVPSNTASSINFGAAGTRNNTRMKTKNCTFLFGHTSSSIYVAALWESLQDSFATSGTVPTTLLGSIDTNAPDIVIEGADVSAISNTLVVGNTNSPAVVKFISPKLHASVTPLGTTISPGSSEVWILDGSYMNGSTLTGRLFYHENHLGSTTVSAAIYNNSSTFTIDGTTKVSWVVDGKAASSLQQPYESPWLDVYHSGTSEITPSLEVMRDNAAGAAYTDAQVWSRWAYKATADSARFTFVQDRAAPLASAANQTTGTLTGSDWTGETGTPWYGKLESGSITPAEIGYIRAGVSVAGDYTVYVDPQIYGLT